MPLEAICLCSYCQAWIVVLVWRCSFAVFRLVLLWFATILHLPWILQIYPHPLSLDPSFLASRLRVAFPINFVFIRMAFCQNVKRTLRESQICGREGSRRKMRDSPASGRGQLVSGKRLLPDKCTRQERFVRRRKRGASAITPSGLLFAFSTEELFTFQIEKSMGKSTAKIHLSEGFSPEWGLKSGDMRTTSPRFAEKKSV